MAAALAAQMFLHLRAGFEKWIDPDVFPAPDRVGGDAQGQLMRDFVGVGRTDDHVGLPDAFDPSKRPLFQVEVAARPAPKHRAGQRPFRTQHKE